MPFRQDTSYLAIGERTNANGSKKFREAMLEGRWDDCVEMARDQIREGAHMLDLCVDYVGRDGVADMEELAGRFATASTLPIVLDSTEVDVIRAGLEKLGGRAVINSVNYEDGDGPESRFARVTELAREHGAALIALTIDEEGQARTAEKKVEIAERLIADLTGNWGIHESDILVDCLTFTICTGQEESRKDGVATIEGIRELKRRHPDVQTTLGLSNISFGLNPAARILLNSVFLDECVKAGLDSAIVHASKILPIARFDEEQVTTALDLIYDRRREGYDPLQKLMQLFEGATAKSLKASKAEELAALPLDERLKRRIIDGERNGLEQDLDEALQERPALDIVNETLLDGMKVVGELFGSGQMQLPFVLQSAEVMKSAVAHLEPHMEKTDDQGKGTIVLATVRGDVHDIGKNLVDIILSNNGYNVVNLGIKQPVSAILEAADEHRADVIGMSGLLVKSTVIMKENLEELNQRGLAADYPVILGGAALTRAYVEQDLHEVYDGEVRYARDAFEGLRLMDALIGIKRGVPGAKLPELKQRRVRAATVEIEERPEEGHVRSDVATDNPVPEPPFWGTRVIKGIQLKEYASWLDEGALFKGQWGLKQARTGEGPSYEELVETEGRPRLRGLLDRLQTENLLEAAVVHGYFPCVSKDDDLIILDDDGNERTRFTFPASAAAGVCAWPTSSARRSPASGTSSASRSSPSAPASARRPPGCSRPTPTGTISNCTACPSSSPRPSPSTGTPGCAPNSASAARTRPRWRTCSPSSTGAPASPSATAPARTWRTAPRSPTCSGRSASASTCRRSSSSTPSSPPTPSSSTTRRRSTSTPAEAPSRWGSAPLHGPHQAFPSRRTYTGRSTAGRSPPWGPA